MAVRLQKLLRLQASCLMGVPADTLARPCPNLARASRREITAVTIDGTRALTRDSADYFRAVDKLPRTLRRVLHEAHNNYDPESAHAEWRALKARGLTTEQAVQRIRMLIHDQWREWEQSFRRAA